MSYAATFEKLFIRKYNLTNNLQVLINYYVVAHDNLLYGIW